MRIRKRAVPLPFADPNFRLLQLIHPSDLPAAAPSSPRSLLKPFQDQNTNEPESTSNQSDLGAVADDNGVELIPSPLSNQTTVHVMEERWCDGDKAIPLKKRKASFEMNGMVLSGKYSKMNSKTNKKSCLNPIKMTEDDDGDYDEEDDDSDSDAKNRKMKKKAVSKKKKTTRKKKGGILMEGSRCSRVNGRGWRCMQSTLVGYSLCEHHLGKGRIRSMSSVRARSINLNSPTITQVSASDNAGKPNDDLDDDDDMEKKLMNSRSRKRMRVGMVKARSLSSLLCQTNQMCNQQT